MLQVNLPVVDIIHTQNNKFVARAKIKETGDLKLIDTPIMSVTVDVVVRCFKYTVN